MVKQSKNHKQKALPKKKSFAKEVNVWKKMRIYVWKGDKGGTMKREEEEEGMQKEAGSPEEGNRERHGLGREGAIMNK